MNRIDKKFKELKEKKEKALITYIMAGDPDLKMTQRSVLAIEEGGADLIELGVPFTDPLADGPVIQKAASRGLNSRTDIEAIFKFVKRVRQKSDIPIILMSYYNPIFQYGEEKFARHACQSGVDGVIIPDLPAGESDSWQEAARKMNVRTIFLLAPTSSYSRIKKVAKASSGFIYYVALTGITGSKLTITDEIRKKVKEIQKVSSLPVAVGFGISTPAEARQISRGADGIIVGSAIVKKFENPSSSSLLPSLKRFIRSLKKELL